MDWHSGKIAAQPLSHLPDLSSLRSEATKDPRLLVKLPSSRSSGQRAVPGGEGHRGLIFHRGQDHYDGVAESRVYVSRVVGEAA